MIARWLSAVLSGVVLAILLVPALLRQPALPEPAVTQPPATREPAPTAKPAPPEAIVLPAPLAPPPAAAEPAPAGPRSSAPPPSAPTPVEPSPAVEERAPTAAEPPGPATFASAKPSHGEASPVKAPLVKAPLLAVPLASSPAAPIPAALVPSEDRMPPLAPLGSPTTPAPTAEKPLPRVVGTATASPSPAQVAEGRALLRMLEHGHGPTIDIGWPGEAAVRERVYLRLTGCHGMRHVLLGPDRVPRRIDAAGAGSEPLDGDRYSGFVRHHTGARPAVERRDLAALPPGSGGAVVRVFPRAIDASLLGGLRALVGPGYQQAGSIRARYRLDAGEVVVGEISVDGTPVAGSIALAKHGCR